MPSAAAGAGVVGFLIETDTSTTHPVAGSTVIGSDPSGDPEVVIGAATMIVIHDPGVDEVHVRITVSSHGVTAEDASGGRTWVQSAGGPMTMLSGAASLRDGTQLRVGGRTFVFRANQGFG